MENALLTFIKQNFAFPPGVAEDIVAQFQPRTVEKGELILRAGNVSDEYLFLESGLLRAYLHDTEGEEITLSFFPAGGVVFEVSSFFQRIPSQENIEALTEARVWAITFEKLNHLFHTVPAFREMGRALLVKGFISFKARTLSLINKTAEQRYEALLQEQPEIFQHAPLKHIASFLGITDSSLSRIRREMTRK